MLSPCLSRLVTLIGRRTLCSAGLDARRPISVHTPGLVLGRGDSLSPDVGTCQAALEQRASVWGLPPVSCPGPLRPGAPAAWWVETGSAPTLRAPTGHTGVLLGGPVWPRPFRARAVLTGGGARADLPGPPSVQPPSRACRLGPLGSPRRAALALGLGFPALRHSPGTLKPGKHLAHLVRGPHSGVSPSSPDILCLANC